MNDEKVLCVRSKIVGSVLRLQWEPPKTLAFFLDRTTYRNRHTPNGNDPDVEHDDRWKQLIPYIVVVNNNGQILAYNRGSKGGEKRLENLWAIGVGGHVNDGDADWMAGIKRELREELDINQPVAFDSRFYDKPTWAKLYGPIGFINDDCDDVGRHHLGVVYVLRADEVVPRENPEWKWRRPAGVEMLWDSLENWARLALPMVRAWMESERE